MLFNNALHWLQVPIAVNQPSARDAASPFTSKFDSLVDNALESFKIPSLSIAVVDGDQTFSKVI
jgi:hypothetical protein